MSASSSVRFKGAVSYFLLIFGQEQILVQKLLGTNRVKKYNDEICIARASVHPHECSLLLNSRT